MSDNNGSITAEQDRKLRKLLLDLATKHGDHAKMAALFPDLHDIDLVAAALGALWADGRDPLETAEYMLQFGIDDAVIPEALARIGTSFAWSQLQEQRQRS